MREPHHRNRPSLHFVTDAPAVLMFVLLNLAAFSLLFVAMLTLQELGRRLGERDIRHYADGPPPATGGTEGAVYGLLGLFLAFTFSAAGVRFEARRHLVVDEANAIGTAWLLVDLLPDHTQSHMRDLFRQYTDARLERYRSTADRAAVEAATTKYRALQREIWSSTMAAARELGPSPPYSVLLPPLAQMIDITTTRETVFYLHTPAAVFLMVTILALIGSVFTGYDMAGKARRWVHTFGFAAVMAMALFVIVDLEFPRLGLIRIDAVDSTIYDVRRSMN